MTEKRFKLSEPNGAYLIDNDEPKYHWINDDDKIIDLLNSLTDKNEQLQKKNDNLVHMIARVQYRADSIKDENEQLKVDKQALIDFIRKEFPKSHKHILEGFE